MINEGLALLLGRNSQTQLSAPAPNAEQLDLIYRAALRAPDHGWLRPWRFLTIEGPALTSLGDLFANAAENRNPVITADELEKFRKQPLRAPMIITVIATVKEHPKVPAQEQIIAAGCAAHGILLAAHALGYGAVWRTGDNASDLYVAEGLGLSEGESIVGFIYLGTPGSGYKSLPELNPADFSRQWHGSPGK